MSSTSQVTDFSDLYTDLQNRVRVTTGLTATETQAKRYINIALQDLHIGFGEKFPWAERQAYLRTRPSYATGTVTLTKGSTTVTGASTLWTTVDEFSVANVRAGGKVTFGDGDVYEVSSVSGATTLVLSTAFIGTTSSGTSYTYYEDEYALASNFLRPIDLRRFSSPSNIELISRTEFRRRFLRNNVPGKPTVGTLLDLAPSGNTTPIRKIRFYQPPSTTLLIPYSYVTSQLVVSSAGVAQTAFSANADEPIVPLPYRHVIVLQALYNWYRDKKDDARSQEVKADYTQLLIRITGDTEIGAVRPQITPRVGSYVNRARRPWTRTTNLRHVTGTRFDEMR